MVSTNGHTGQIPVIDLSGPENDVAQQLVDAAATYGFVYVRSLGKDIPVAAIDNMFALVIFPKSSGLYTLLILYSPKSSFLLPLKRRNPAKFQKMYDQLLPSFPSKALTESFLE